MGCGCNKKQKPKKPAISKKAMVDMVKSKIYVDENILNYRHTKCLSCPFLRKKDEKIYTLEHARCGKCGCFILAKTKLKLSKCPIGEW